MKRIFLLSFLMIPVMTINAQVISVQSGPWSSSATWSFGTIPDANTDVVIGSGHIVNVDNQSASCKSISFGDNNSKLSMVEGSVLNVYGNFTLASTTHNAFSTWGLNAKIRFTGSEVQKLSGWSTSAFSTSFQYMLVDKSDGKVVTDSTNMRLGIGDTLEVLNGTFELNYQDDIETRTFSGSASSATFIIRENGNFNMVGSLSHIRRASNTAITTSRTGTLHVFGIATIRSTSTNRVNFDNIIVYSGGRLSCASFSSTNAGLFNPDTVEILAGGEIRVSSTTSFWEPSATVILNEGGEYRVNASSPDNAFPDNFINNGTVRYASSSTQTVKDMDYHRLEFSFEGTKTWNLTGNRVVADSLEINNTAYLVLNASEPYTVSVGNVLRLTTGTIDNLNANANIKLANGGEISRATGSILKAPEFGTTVNVRYTSSSGSITTGPELPTATNVLNNLYIFSTGQTVTLGENAVVNGTLTLSAGIFDNNGANNDKVLSIANNGNIRRATGSLTSEPNFQGSINVDYISVVDSVSTGYEIPTDNFKLKNLTVSGNKGVVLNKDIFVNGNVTLTGSFIYTEQFKLVLNVGALLNEQNNLWVYGNILAERNLSQPAVENFGNIGITINYSGISPGLTSVTRKTGEDITPFGIRRHYDISPTVNSGLNATLEFSYRDDEPGQILEENLALYKSTDNGDNWTKMGGTVDVQTNKVTLSGIENFSRWALNHKDSIISVKDLHITPEEFSLFQNFPNPFNPSTEIKFQIPVTNELKNKIHTTLKVFDILGKEVVKLVDEELSPGMYKVEFHPSSGLVSGVYFYQLNAGSFNETKKMILIK